jgi:putative ABC transport system permease protein
VILRFLPLLWANLWRNRRRSILTVLGVAVSIYVYAALGAAIDGITFPVREVGAERVLNVREAARANVLSSRLPMSYEDRVADVSGVASATGVLADLAVVGRDRVHIFVRGIDPERFREVQRLRVDPGAWRAFVDDQRAALVGHRLLARMGWRVGQKVEIREIALRVVVVGVIPPQGLDLESHMLVRRRYLQGIRDAENQISYVLAAPEDGRDAAAVAAAIDETFALAPLPTESGTASAYAEAIIEDFMGFVDYLRLMGFITVLITMLGAANAIAMNVRERTREMGVLKAIGFSPGLILSLILAESTLLSTIGGAIGLGAAAVTVGTEGANLAGLMLSPSTTAISAILALAIGLLGGLLPALSAARLPTVEALRVIG